MLSSTRANVARRAAFAVVCMLALPAVAEAQACPVGSTCYFGTDIDGSRTTRASSVNSAAERDAFLAAITGEVTATFEDVSVGTTNPMLVLPGYGTATFAGGGSVRQVVGPGTDGNGRYATSGSRFYQTVSSAGRGGNILTFSSPVTAFGFSGIDIGDFGSQLSLVFRLTDGTSTGWDLPYDASNGRNSSRDGSILFAGFTNSTGFTSVQFVGTDAADNFAFDDLTVGVAAPSVVPEPSTYGLLATGLVGLGLAVRRRARV